MSKATMTAAEIDALAGAIGPALRRHRSLLMQELRIHDAIENALIEAGIAYVREYVLERGSRLDFWLPDTRTAIEVKKRNAGLGDLAQVARYLDNESVAGCILIAVRISPEVPAVLRGKPVGRIALWKYLL